MKLASNSNGSRGDQWAVVSRDPGTFHYAIALATCRPPPRRAGH